MVNKELIGYVEQCRKLGQSDSQIMANLKKEGWGEADILEAMFKYSKPKRKTPKGLFLAGLIIVGILIILMIGGILFMLNDIEKISSGVEELKKSASVSNQNTGNVQETEKTYKDTFLGFEVTYPENILTLDSEKATLAHTMKNFHKYSPKDGADLGLAENMKIVFKKNTEECNNADNNIEEDGEAFVSGVLKGLKYEMGAEGEGEIIYCFRDDEGNNIFMISRYFLSEAWSSEISKQPDFISLQKQAEIFEKILASFKLI